MSSYDLETHVIFVHYIKLSIAVNRNHYKCIKNRIFALFYHVLKFDYNRAKCFKAVLNFLGLYLKVIFSSPTLSRNFDLKKF